MITSNEDKQIEKIIDDFWSDRVGFAKYIVGMTPTDQQGDALKALDTDDHVAVASGHGCHAYGTGILMADGSVKEAQCIQHGDRVMGDDSRPRTVLKLFRGEADMYRVRYSDGTFYDVNGAHTLCLVATQTHGRQKTGNLVEVTVEEYLRWSGRKRRTHAGYKKPVELPEREIPIPPYILGLWLGDGCSRSTGLTNVDAEVIEAWREYAGNAGLRIRTEGITIHLVGDKYTNEYPRLRVNEFKQNLQELGLINNKHVPAVYLRGSMNQRLELLAGLLDTDGGLEAEGSRYSITQKRKLLAEQIKWLAQSVGCHATLNEVSKTCANNGKRGIYHCVGITRNIELIPLRIKRKKTPVDRKKQRQNLHFGIEVEAIGTGDYFGFQVDGNNRYLQSDFTVTRNCGKSGVQSVTALHYMSTRYFPKIPCTAPSKHQLYDVLWAELSKWHRKMNPLFGHLFIWTKEKFFHKQHPEEWFAVARTATKENPEALQGFHADYILRIIDEASGVPEPIFEVADGAHGRLETKELLCANPTRLEGTFYQAFHKNKGFYKTFKWSCLDSPIAPSDYCERIERKYGRDSNIYRIRVKGEFPFSDGDTFIPYHLAEDALHREIPPQKEFKKVFGVDVARFGDDDTAIAIRQGDEILPIHVLHGKGTMEVAGHVARLANIEKPAQIFVDVIGIGAGVYDRLEELGFPVVPINVSESPAQDAVKYKRLRDELWGNTRDWLEMRRGHIHDNEDRDLIGELTTPKYHITSDGKIVIESKDDMKKRGLASPNRADAVIMTFAQPIVAYRGEDDFFEDDNSDEYKPLDIEAGY